MTFHVLIFNDILHWYQCFPPPATIRFSSCFNESVNSEHAVCFVCVLPSILPSTRYFFPLQLHTIFPIIWCRKKTTKIFSPPVDRWQVGRNDSCLISWYSIQYITSYAPPTACGICLSRQTCHNWALIGPAWRQASHRAPNGGKRWGPSSWPIRDLRLGGGWPMAGKRGGGVSAWVALAPT